MTHNTKLKFRANAAAVDIAEYGAISWLVPPVLLPALLAIMIGMRAAYLAYPW